MKGKMWNVNKKVKKHKQKEGKKHLSENLTSYPKALISSGGVTFKSNLKFPEIWKRQNNKKRERENWPPVFHLFYNPLPKVKYKVNC